jgi:lipopolysaccharide/colanic/teichoic acid biosynthesis glycosyltransferase
VNVIVVYIGSNDKFISHFREILNGNLIVCQNINEFTNELNKQEALPLMILFEKGNLQSDIPKIEQISYEHPLAYLVLVARKIDKQEILAYQAAGIKDTAHPEVSMTRMQNGLEFVARNQALIADARLEHEPLGTYKIPVWKRFFDIVFSLSAIIILSPFLIVIALIIVIESPGPIIYKSKRVGSNYEIFDFFKFRSMYKDADKRLKEFMNLNQYQDVEPDYYNYSEDTIHIPVIDINSADCFVSDDDVISEEEFLRDKNIKRQNNFIKYENDPRITKMGRFIRKYSIDELPQIINILKGDMSIVGNRPLPLYEAEQLTSDQYIDRFMGPAGLTGLWQVEKRGDSGKLSPEERKQLDIYYAKHFSFWMDLKIVFKTFTAFIQKENV